MEGQRGIELTYITERIINLYCPAECPEGIYLQNLQEIILMLQSKHRHKYMLINLSRHNDYLTGMNHKVLDTGWVDFLAPSLDQIFTVYHAMENWLQAHPKHIVALHCWGGKGRLGVLVASYIHFSSMLPSADLCLHHFAMRRFYNDKLSALMTPSQKRYVWMLGNMLKGGLKMCPSPSFLLCVVLYGLPKLRPDGACCLFLRVYQSLHVVCTSAVYHVNAAQTDRLYFVLQPAQLLKGDIMVVCYDKNSHSASRQVVFRLQFHTGLVNGHTLAFPKADLDCASQDARFPDDGKVELFLSDSPEKITGRELWHNNPRCVTVDYDTLDPLVRRDSYHNTSASAFHTAPHHVPHLGNSIVFSSGVRKTSCEQSSSSSVVFTGGSSSSDSGLSSVASQGQSTAARERRTAPPTKPFSGRAVHIAQPLLEVMTELAAFGRGEPPVEPTAGGEVASSEPGSSNVVINGEAASPSGERETDILDDDDDEEEEENEQVAPARDHAPSSSSVGSLSSESLPRADYSAGSTGSWVRQQQMVGADADADTNTDTSLDATDGEDGSKQARKAAKKPPPLVAPCTPPRGVSSRVAVQQRVGETRPDNTATNNQQQQEDEDEDLATLTTDVDESIDQLNRLILDLDPTFVPVQTGCSPLSRSASLHTNGVSHKGATHLAGWRQQKQQHSDLVDYGGLHSPGWRAGSAQSFNRSPLYSPSFSPTQHGHLYKSDSVDYRSHTDSSEGSVPQTPAFPVSPPTPYVKTFSEFSQLRTGGEWDQHSWTQDSRGFLDSMNHTSGSTDGEMFRSDSSVAPRIFGSMCSVSSDSALPHTDSPTPPLAPVWHERSPNSCSNFLNSPYAPQPSPPPASRLPLSLSSPKAHSSPRGALRGLDLDQSLLEDLEGVGGGLVPLLPEKRRGGEAGGGGAELMGSHSPSLSGFSSPHSSSSLSIPFSSPILTPDPLRGLSGATSPDFGSKQDTVKFVQDTSKFWYKPNISRDQAIAVLKDKEPGSFVVRDSHSFRGAYGLAMKVATPPPAVVQQSKKVGDLSNELVRHFLIECTQKGVRLKGCPNEPYFGSLTALVCQHSITPLALPCRLILPDRDPVEELSDSPAQTATNSAAELLKQGAACNVWFLGSVELESLTGLQAVQKATTLTLAKDPPPASTVVHFKVSAQGITLTDNQRKLFFRRHYAVNTVIFCSLDPQGRKWTRGSSSTAKIFGFVARKSQSDTENMCHLFAEHDPEQPASAIVNFVSKVMIGSHKK